VLVVEDSVTNQMVAVGILEHLGYTSDVAANGLEALDALDRRKYDAVLMDCQMPEMDGYDATREQRRREGDGARTPVIAMTAGVTEGERERCLAAGMDDYVPKPVTPASIDTALSRWVRSTTA
jgi:CheY-like chemotaxis protein